MPMVNQIERHPCRKQSETYEYCRAHDVQLEAYQPLAVARPELMKNELLMEIATMHNCSVPQVALAWNIATGVITLPRSTNPERLRENFNALQVRLSPEEVSVISNDHEHYFRALPEGVEYPGYWDEIHKVNIENYL